MARRLVCICNFITEKEIVSILEKGATSAKDIQMHTRAGSSCGRCLPEIDQIVEQYEKEKPKDQQKRLDLGF